MYTNYIYMYVCTQCIYVQSAEESKEEGAPSDLPTSTTPADVAVEDEEEETEGDSTRTLLAYTSE